MGLPPGLTMARSTAITPLRSEVSETGKGTPPPGALLRWLLDASATDAPVITTTSNAAGRFVLVRPARAASRVVVQALADPLTVPTTGAPYGRATSRPGVGQSESDRPYPGLLVAHAGQRVGNFGP